MKALAAVALLLGGAAEARFAPRTDVAYRVVRVQEHDDPRGSRRFESERRLVFARLPDGYLATLTLTGTRDNVAGSDYALLAAALDGQPVEVELDRAGHVRTVRNLDAIWARLRVAIGKAAPGDDLRLALWRLHDAATTTQRAQVVAGALMTVLGGDDAGRRAGTRAVTLAPEGPGQGVALTGVERVRVDHAAVAVETEASASGAVLSRHRAVDRRSGLVSEQREQRQGTVPIGGTVQTMTDRTTITCAPVS